MGYVILQRAARHTLRCVKIWRIKTASSSSTALDMKLEAKIAHSFKGIIDNCLLKSCYATTAQQKQEENILSSRDKIPRHNSPTTRT